MGKPTSQNNSFVNHFSHPHPLHLVPATSSPPCSACKLAGGNGRVYSCRPCNFSLHESCSKMSQVITHPSHPSHTLSLLVAPIYDGGYFNCDGCGTIGTGFSYQCTRCDFDIHALCAYKPLSIVHRSHPQHSLKLAFHSPYGANKGFSCDICLKIGTNQWLYRCIPCEFDAHVGCITAAQPHLFQHNSPVPTPHAHHVGHPQHPSSLPMPNQGINRPRPRPMSRVNRPIDTPIRPNGPIGNPNRLVAQNAATYEPIRQSNNLVYNGPNGPIGPNEVSGQRESFDQGSMEGSGYGGSAVNEEFNGEVDVEIEYEADGYEGTEDGDFNDKKQDVDGNRLQIVAYGNDDDVSCSESEFGGSSDARSQCNDLSVVADLYPQSVRTNQRRVGRNKNPNPNGPAARSKNTSLNGRGGRLQGSTNAIQSPRRPQNVRNNAVRAGGSVGFNGPRDPAPINGPPRFNEPSGGASNVTDSGGNNDNYNEVNGADMYDGYGESYGDDYVGQNGDCDFEAGGDFVDDGYDQSYDETYGENDFECYSDITGGSKSMYDGDESYGTMNDSKYSGLNDEPNNQFSPMVGPAGGPGMNNQNQYGQTGRPMNMGNYGGRGDGTTNMNSYGNMNQDANSSQSRGKGRPAQYRPNGGPYRANRRPNGPYVELNEPYGGPNRPYGESNGPYARSNGTYERPNGPYGGSNGPYGGPNGPNGPTGNTMMNTMVQGLCQGLAMNMLIGGGVGDVNGGAGGVNGGTGDGNGSSFMGG